MPEKICPSCGARFPAQVLGDHCPRCLLLEGLDSDPPTTSGGYNGAPIDQPARSASVLETIAATLGGVPRILLRDTALGEQPSPIVRPIDADPSIRYRIDGEIARGGMGAVLKGRDPDLGRDVAIKVLRVDLRDNGDLVRRFVEEAQIGGQLQHPGVVPIYELGTFADRRPYFSMKLLKGQTLADLLAARSGPADDLPRFLSIYSAIAQTMAYSHTRGVIHRDLKPSNVMVGSFGEVQVMDWGLAKVLPRGGATADAKAGKESPPETLIATARSGSDTDLSRAGSVLGTPSYMPPEQARGETDLINERADVFALGSILAEILTGSPAFTGRNSTEIVRKAARGDTVDALARLDACGAEGELIGLASGCLAVEPEDRPRDANVVAERITAYLAGVQERVQAAERERTVAVARAVEERRRRKVQLALAASVLALSMLGGLSATYYLQQRVEQARLAAAQEAAVNRVLGEAETLRDQAKAHPEDLARWQVALAAVKQAEAVRDEGAQRRLLDLHTAIQAGLNSAQRDKVLLDRLIDIRSAEADDEDGSVTDAAYAEAFRTAEIDLTSLAPAEAGAKIKARPPSVALALAAALDDWAAIRRDRRKNAAGAAQLSAVARVADPDVWRNELRTALDQTDKAVRLAGLQAQAKTANFDELGPISLKLLGTGLSADGDPAAAESVLRMAQRQHPGDVWLNYELGRVLESLERHDEAIRFFTAARVIRPETGHSLGHLLESRGDNSEAIAVFCDLIAMRPMSMRHMNCMGGAIKGRGRSREIKAVLEQAVAAHRDEVRLKPDSAEAHSNLAITLEVAGKIDEALAEFRTVKRLDPKQNIGATRPVMASFVDELGRVQRNGRMGAFVSLDDKITELSRRLGASLKKQGKLDEAIAVYRHLTQLEPASDSARITLATALKEQGKLDEAVTESREAIRLNPASADAHITLANSLKAQGKMDEAIAAYREAIRLEPASAPAYSSLVPALKAGGKLESAVAAYREAIRKKPDDAEAHLHLAGILRAQGDLAGSLATLKTGHELGSKQPGWKYPSAKWVADAENPAIYDSQADPGQLIANAVARAKRANKRVLLQFGGNWCPWCHKLLDVFQNNSDVRRVLSHEYELVLIDSEQQAAQDLIAEYGLLLNGVPFLVVLDAEGNLVHQQRTGELVVDGHHDPEKVTELLKKYAAPRDAETVLQAALATASSEGKRVFLRFGSPWSKSGYWSNILDDFLARPEIQPIMARDFVDANVHLDRMNRSLELEGRFVEKPAQQGIPWIAILDSQGKVLITSNGKNGNIGYPGQPEEIDHFMKMLRSSAKTITPEEMKTIESTLRAEGKKILSRAVK
jgi:serine/threonine-protein kinase